ncbi:MAG: hypothetical protein HOI95_10345 [Chromatiales bacterium]|nr:hypothetical protein [Chromatiales bacterium]
MTLYKISDERLESTTFQQVGVLERQGLQPLLRANIEIVVPDALVLAEEFSNWEDSRRRIDLLALDSQARLVVIELKRTEDGGHMELQSLRYAAMISNLTFDQAVTAHADYLGGARGDSNARQAVLDFLGWEEEREGEFAQDVRIVIASADFSKEITTSVLWLNACGLDITCVRLQPYRDGDTVLLDVQQVVPLPEASEYMVRLRDKQARERQDRAHNRDFTRFDVFANDVVHANLPKRRAMYEIVRAIIERGVSPAQIKDAIPWRGQRLFFEVEREVDGDSFTAAALAERDGRFDASRWYCDDGDLLHIDGITYALSTQWGSKTREAMQELVDRHGDGVVRFAETSQSA